MSIDKQAARDLAICRAVVTELARRSLRGESVITVGVVRSIIAAVDASLGEKWQQAVKEDGERRAAFFSHKSNAVDASLGGGDASATGHDRPTGVQVGSGVSAQRVEQLSADQAAQAAEPPSDLAALHAASDLPTFWHKTGIFHRCDECVQHGRSMGQREAKREAVGIIDAMLEWWDYPGSENRAAAWMNARQYIAAAEADAAEEGE